MARPVTAKPSATPATVAAALLPSPPATGISFCTARRTRGRAESFALGGMAHRPENQILIGIAGKLRGAAHSAASRQVRAPGSTSTVARTLRYISRARPRQSNPAPRFAVEAGTRTSNELCRGAVIGLGGIAKRRLAARACIAPGQATRRYRRRSRVSRIAALFAATRSGEF